MSPHLVARSLTMFLFIATPLKRAQSTGKKLEIIDWPVLPPSPL